MKTQTASKSVYFLMEVIIVIFLFSLSSLICMQVHVRAVSIQEEADATRYALREATSILEGIKAGHYPKQCEAHKNCTWEVEENKQSYNFQLHDTQKEQGVLTIKYKDKELVKLPFTWSEGVAQ